MSIALAQHHCIFVDRFVRRRASFLLAAASCFRVLATRATAGCQRFFWEEVLHRVACSAVKVVFLLMNVLIRAAHLPTRQNNEHSGT